MKFLLMLFLFYIKITQAEIIDQSYLADSILTVSQINKGTFLNLPRPECNESVVAIKKNNKELFNQCAIDLCGPPEKNVSQYITDDQFYRSANWWDKLRINFKDSLFNEIYDISINNKLKELEDLKKYIMEPSFENISVEGQIQLTSEILSPYVVITPYPKEKKLEDRISVTTIYPKDADNELKDAINNYAIRLKQSVTTSPQKFNSLGIYTDDELASIIKKMIKKVKESYEGNPESLKDRPKFANDLKMFEKMYETEAPFRAMMDINLRGITNINNYIAQTTKKDSLEQVSCDVKSCKSLFKKHFEKSINKKQVEKNIALYEKFLKNPNAKKKCN